MNRTPSSFSRQRHRAWFSAMVIGFALLLAFSLALPAQAGPTQEKGQEKKEEKEQPKKYTNDDLKKASGSSGGGGDGGTPAQSGPPLEPGETPAPAGDDEAVDPWDSVGVATDSEGRGEAYWRQAMTDARAAVDTARVNHGTLQSELKRHQVDFTAIDDPAARDLIHERIEELFGEVEAAAQAVTDAEKALADLQEDARRSGALPGWLR